VLRKIIADSIWYILPWVYKYDVGMVNGDEETLHKEMGDIRCIIILNHTSLFEFLLIPSFSRKLLSHLETRSINVPIAKETLGPKGSSPVLRRLYKLLVGKDGALVPLTRKRDASWREYLNSGSDNVWVMLPEGRMKRENGLDKHGKKMTVRSGLADVLKGIPHGKLLVIYSGGLHHVAYPGKWFPKIFKNLHYKLELFDISELHKKFNLEGNFKRYVINLVDFFDKRRDEVCPGMEESCTGG